MKRKIIGAILAIAIAVVNPFGSIYADDKVEQSYKTVIDTSDLSKEQLSSVAMLNYLTVLTQEINSSENSQLYLDNAYSSIINNINYNAINNEDTLNQIDSILNTIHAYQMIDEKRDRLEYIYEQNQAQALRSAIPNPLGLLSAVQSGNIIKLAASVLYMAVDSVTSYQSCASEADKKYMEDGWKLDDEASENLNESNIDAFNYAARMCKQNGINNRLALRQNTVEEFVKWENNDSVIRRISFLEDNKGTYQAYGKYWLVLAKSYYENEEFQKCIDSVQQYQNLNIDTFSKNHELANILPMAIDSASHQYKGNSYVSKVENYDKQILDNIEVSDWELRYFVAQSYVDLHSRTGDKAYLQKAYDLVKQNINDYLIDEQHTLNDAYIKDLEKVQSKNGDTKAKKAEIKEYNKWMKEERKTELPPVYQPLTVNCDLLFALANEIGVSDNEKKEVNEILHGEGTLFLVDPIDKYYSFDTETGDLLDFVFSGTEIKIPAAYLTEDATIKVTVNSDGKDTIYDNWTIDKVNRKESNNISTFIATYQCKGINKQDYNADSTVKLEIIPPDNVDYEKTVVNFRVSRYTKFLFMDSTSFEMVR